MMMVVQDARDRYQKLVGTVARDIESEKERVQEQRDAQIDEQINKDKQLNNSLSDEIPNGPTANGLTEQNEEEIENAEQLQNGLDLCEMAKDGKFKLPGSSDRKSYQQHSRNASAASGISICSYVSQPVSDRDWKEFVQDSEDEKDPERIDLTKSGNTIVENGEA